MNVAIIGDDEGVWVTGPPAQVVTAIAELTRERDLLVAEPITDDLTELAARYRRAAVCSARLAGWWGVLARHSTHLTDTVPGWELYQWAAWQVRRLERDQARRWRASAAGATWCRDSITTPHRRCRD